MNYEEAKNYLKNMPAFVPSRIASGEDPYNLDAVIELLKRLGNPEKELTFIHVAGTNGKGSTIAFLDSILWEAGLKCGTFRTPQLMEFTETVTLGEDVSPEKYAGAMSKIIPIREEMGKEGLQAPSEFEMMLAAALLIFKEEKVDIAILEAGLGGRLDATNVIPAPILTIITPIGLDHVEILGDTISKIAREKAGIIKTGSRVISALQTEEAAEVLAEVCRKKKVSLDFSDMPEDISFDAERMVQNFFYRGKRAEISMLGLFQPENAILAWKAAEMLRDTFRGKEDFLKNGKSPLFAIDGITAENILTGLKKAFWPARFEIVNKNPLIICDGTHNAPGAKVLKKSVKTYFSGRKIHYVSGILADKNHGDMIKMLLDTAEDFRTVPVCSGRGYDAGLLAEEIRKLGGKATSFSSIEEAFYDLKKELAAKDNNDVIISFGSLYNAGRVRKIVKEIFE